MHSFPVIFNLVLSFYLFICFYLNLRHLNIVEQLVLGRNELIKSVTFLVRTGTKQIFGPILGDNRLSVSSRVSMAGRVVVRGSIFI